MVQEVKAITVVDEFYNLSQLAEVTLAAGKLSTTNIQQIKDYIHEQEQNTVVVQPPSSPPLPLLHTSPHNGTNPKHPLNIKNNTLHKHNDIVLVNTKKKWKQNWTTDLQRTECQRGVYTGAGGYCERPLSHYRCDKMKTHSDAVSNATIRTNTSDDATRTIANANVSNITGTGTSANSPPPPPPTTTLSDDDSSSTYSYSHKIFDKRKVRQSVCGTASDGLAPCTDPTGFSAIMPEQKRQKKMADIGVNNNGVNGIDVDHESDMADESEMDNCSNATVPSTDDFDEHTMKSEKDDSEEAAINCAENIDDIHVCPECGKKYSTSSNLARHRQTHRSLEDKKARRCPHCDKVYVSMPAFSMHVRTHNQGCECPHCGKCFSRPWLLQGHIRTHTGEKPFKCSVCAKAFADKSNLRAHIQTHSNTKPHSCVRCGKAFALKSYLYKHEESSCMRNHVKVQKDKGKVNGTGDSAVRKSNGLAQRALRPGKKSTATANLDVHDVNGQTFSLSPSSSSSSSSSSSRSYNEESSRSSNSSSRSSSSSSSNSSGSNCSSTEQMPNLDAGDDAKKSYIELVPMEARHRTPTSAANFSRISVIQAVTNNAAAVQFQDKPMDYSPKTGVDTLNNNNNNNNSHNNNNNNNNNNNSNNNNSNQFELNGNYAVVA